MLKDKIHQVLNNLNQAWRLAKNSDTPLRIVEMQACPKTKQSIFVVQVSNKNIFMRYTANEIMADKRLTNYLSQDDLTFIKSKVSQTNDIKVKDFKIVAFEFNSESNDYLYTIRFLDDSKELVKDFSLHELLEAKNQFVFEQLDATDNTLIEYHRGRIKLFS